MQLEHARVVAHQPVSEAYRLLILDAPALAPLVAPGQFVHLRVPNLDGAVLRRPFSVFKTDAATLSILYKRVGRGTEAMTALKPGDEVSLMGPLGNGFPVKQATGFPVLVAGGFGVAPLYLLARQLPRRGLLFVGGAGAADILCTDDFAALGWPARVVTEDGSRGERGFVTVALDAWLDREGGRGQTPEFWACGPTGMLRAVGERAVAGDWRAWLSLDRHMGCGVGACLACVQRLRRDGKEFWGRVCTEGPVFEARDIVWES